MSSLQERIAKTKAGTKVKVVVKRSDDGEYKKKTLTVTLGKKSDSAQSQENGSGNNGSGNSNNDNSQNGGNGFFGGNGRQSNPFQR